MGFELVLAGLIFLINPNFNIIDLIPDFIGYWLICAGLRKLSMVNADILYAKSTFLKLLFVNLGKVFSIFFIDMSDPTRFLLLSFVFGLAEVLLFFKAVGALFEGIDHVGMRLDSKAVLASYTSKIRKRQIDVSTKVKFTMLFFFTLRTVLSVLPELTELQDDSIISSNRIVYSNFKGVFYLFGSVICLIAAVFFVIQVGRFFSSLKKDTDFNNKLNLSYNRLVEINRNYYISGNMLPAVVLYIVAIFFLINQSETGLAKMPLILSAFALSACVIIIARLKKSIIFALIPTVTVSVLSIVELSLQDKFFVGNAKFEDIFHFEKSMDSFSVISNVALAEYICLAVAFIWVSLVLIDLIESHIPLAVSTHGYSIDLNDAEVEENSEHFEKYAKSISVISIITLFMYTSFTKLSLVFGELAAFIDKSDVNVPSIIYSLFTVSAAGLNIAWFVLAILMFGFIKKNVYGKVYAWSLSEDYIKNLK